MALINNIIQIEEFTLVAGNTDIVYSESGTMPNSLIGLYCDTYGVYPQEVKKEGNSIHITYEAQAVDIHVALIFFKGEFNVVNNLTSTSETDALSAAQGKALKDLIDALGVPALDELSDVNISEVSADNILIYDSVSEKWINAAYPAIPNDINDLSDVNITSPSDDEVLTYDNGVWINKPAQGGSGGINYSANEQDTGIKWIDNKAIYQKTVTINNITISSNNATTLTLSDYFSSVDMVVDFECVTVSGYIMPSVMVNSANAPYSIGVSVDKGDNSIVFSRGSGGSATISVYFTLRYTKTS